MVDGDAQSSAAAQAQAAAQAALQAFVAAQTATTTGPKMNSSYYLHPSDHPGLTICPIALKGDNYNEWVTSMRNAFIAKRKLGFIDGTITKPPPDSADSDYWLSVNSMLVGWIVQSMDPTLRSSVTYYETVKELWDDLKQRFCVGNGPRILQIRTDIALCQQKGQTAAAYYSTLKKLWDELSTYVPLEACTCTNCTCGLNSRLTKARDEERIHQFLMGLDATMYGTLRSNVMAQDPLPPISRVYALVIQEERHKSIIKERDVQSDALAFAARSSNNYNSSPGQYIDKKSLTCSHCGRTGHDNTTCFKIHGFPDWFYEKKGAGRGNQSSGRGRGTPQQEQGASKSAAGRGRGTPGVANAAQQQASTSSGFQPNAQDRHALGSGFSNEQWNSMLQLFQSMNSPASEKLSGPKFEDGDWSG